MSRIQISNELHEIVSDKSSGSSELLNKLNNYFNRNRGEINSKLISLLNNTFSDFQAITSYLDELNEALNNNSLNSFFEKQAEYLLNIYSRIFDNLQNKIKNYSTFITLSNSKTIFEVIKLIANSKEQTKVFVSEGRPICEGRKLAENLADNNNMEVILITEAQIYNAVQKSDCAIIGADKILTTGNVINKVGSNLLALACARFNRTFYVVTDKTKLSDDAVFNKKEMPKVEIYDKVNKNISVNNYYFEEIPGEFITEIITD